ncbi:MAG: Uma2 family endonuclease [Chloroflexi bacterium]|nr:Uma2 family endonuclease [Chloroflexota bacterium]MCY4248761.1 Uma2 family endonuclease [Chloroflexota bacterium]
MAEVIGQPDCPPELTDRRWYMIDGEVFDMSPVMQMHGLLAIRLGAYLMLYADEHNLGEVTTEVGHYPPGDRRTLLAPDVAFTTHARIKQTAPDEFVPLMPDLAVEIASPSDSLAQLRRKAQIYLNNGARLVWIVLPDQRGVDVCRSAVGARLDIEFVGADGALAGEEVLPGFELALSRLFPHPRPS